MGFFTEESVSKMLCGSCLEKYSEDKWQSVLRKAQFNVLRLGRTEGAGTGTLITNFDSGTYVCAGCGNELYSLTLQRGVFHL